MKSRKFLIVAGVEAGYGHDVAGVASDEAVNKVAALWQQLAAEEFEESGIYIAAVVKPAAVVYHADWGCPVGGEAVVELAGAANPQFTKDLDEWQEAVIRLAKKLKVKLKQSTLSIEFSEIDFVYLADQSRRFFVFLKIRKGEF